MKKKLTVLALAAFTGSAMGQVLLTENFSSITTDGGAAPANWTNVGGQFVDGNNAIWNSSAVNFSGGFISTNINQNTNYSFDIPSITIPALSTITMTWDQYGVNASAGVPMTISVLNPGGNAANFATQFNLLSNGTSASRTSTWTNNTASAVTSRIRFNAVTGASQLGNQSYDNFQITTTAIPEPSAALLGGLGALALLRRRRA